MSDFLGILAFFVMAAAGMRTKVNGFTLSHEGDREWLSIESAETIETEK